MKSFIVYTILFAITLQTVGCMSFYPIQKDESIKDYLKTENRLDIRLNNGDRFIISSKDCKFIDKPGDYKTPDFLLIMNDSIIYNKDIKSIQVEKLDSEKTALGLIIGGGFATLFILAMKGWAGKF